jgi:glutathione synthase/RimK-type ligase-like ATP-grasp enzyme
MIVTSFSELSRLYHKLGRGDVFVGQIPRLHLRSTMLVDLQARGVILIPSATARQVNASKAAQAFLLHPWMLPQTRVVTRRKELLDALGEYRRLGIDTLVTKNDRMHCGHGVCKWTDSDILYSCLSTRGNDVYPLVLQPFVETCTDVRVILVGDFCEAYRRTNSSDFRANLAVGGRSRPFELTQEQMHVCRTVLQRCGMPYAHIDLMITPDDQIYASEIRLNAGIQGARITRRQLDGLKQSRISIMAEQATGFDANA